MGYERVMPPRSEAIHVATIRRRYKDKVYETHLLCRKVVRTLPYGHVEVVLGVLRDLGLDKVLLSRPSRQRCSAHWK